LGANNGVLQKAREEEGAPPLEESIILLLNIRGCGCAGDLEDLPSLFVSDLRPGHCLYGINPKDVSEDPLEKTNC